MSWAIRFPNDGVRSRRTWPTRDAACAWASREIGPGPWEAVEIPDTDPSELAELARFASNVRLLHADNTYTVAVTLRAGGKLHFTGPTLSGCVEQALAWRRDSR